MTQRKTRLHTIKNLIETYEELEDISPQRPFVLDVIAVEMAKTLKAYCNHQGNGCEHCKFRLEDPERRNCECKINIGKNEMGTAPRFWELK